MKLKKAYPSGPTATVEIYSCVDAKLNLQKADIHVWIYSHHTLFFDMLWCSLCF